MLAAVKQLVEKTIKVNDCWVWNFSKTASGYGQVYFAKLKRPVVAHRAMLFALGKEIPSNMEVDHLCRERLCINPDHLEIVTPLENVRRSVPYWKSRKTNFCRKGHPFDEINTRIFARDGVPTQICRACKALWSRNKRKAMQKK